ncbi:MAG TPA: hypothetical protein PLZ84_09615, partial [Clostridia bacterium]|nr:hypothetical protein [Clostridia bacterium]
FSLKHVLLEDTPAITVLRQVENQDTVLKRVGDMLYYIDVLNDRNTLVRFNTANSKLDGICPAQGFDISPDGRFAAVVSYGEDSEFATFLSVVDLVPGGAMTEVSSNTLSDFFFGSNSLLYYLAPSDNEKYPVAVYSFNKDTGQSSLVENIVSAQIRPGPDANSLMAFVTEYKNDTLYAATFIVTHG